MSKVKQVDDIMGGASAWQNVDQTNGAEPFPRPLFLIKPLPPGYQDRSVSGAGTDGVVPMCSNKECDSRKAYYRQMQIRSADEPMTTFYKCVDCGTQWREN